jgi:hypothetical protein
MVSEYAYGPPTIRFTGGEIDYARAAGALVDPERPSPIITGRSTYRELYKQADQRRVEELAPALPTSPSSAGTPIVRAEQLTRKRRLGASTAARCASSPSRLTPPTPNSAAR